MLDLGLRERLGKELPTARKREVFRWVGGELFLRLGPLVEGAKGGDLEIQTGGAQRRLGLIRCVGPLAVALVLEEVGEVGEVNVAPAPQPVRARPREELAQQRLIRPLRVLRLPALVPQGEEEIFDEEVHDQRVNPASPNSNGQAMKSPGSLRQRLDVRLQITFQADALFSAGFRRQTVEADGFLGDRLNRARERDDFFPSELSRGQDTDGVFHGFNDALQFLSPGVGCAPGWGRSTS